jgi:hypothetical protein
MIYIVEEIKLLLLVGNRGNRLKHIRGNVRYMVTWNIKVFTVYMASCEIPHEEGWTKGTNCNSWSSRLTL